MINKLKKLAEDAAAMALTVTGMMGTQPNTVAGHVSLTDDEEKIKKAKKESKKENKV